jgi:capsular polysaccharide biosynthesis protein
LHHPHLGSQDAFQELVADATRQDRMGYSVDGWTEGPGVPQSVWRYKWLVGSLVLLGILGASLISATQPTRYEGVVRIFVTAEGPASDPERIVTSHAAFIESPTVSDRVIALTGNRLTLKELEKRLTVEPSANGDFITIRALDATPRNAAGLADAVDLAYRQIISEQRQEGANQAIAALESAQGRLASELTQIRKQRRTDDSPTLEAEEQAKKRQMEATANKIEETSAGAAGPPPALQDKAAVPDEPAQPKPLRAGAIGAVVGLVIGVALAWLLAARRRIRSSEDIAESQAPDDDLEAATEVVDDLVEQPLTHEPVSHAALHVDGAASDIQESPEQVPRLADVDRNRVTASVRQTANTLGKDNDLLSSLADWLETQHQNFPQITAERLRDRLPFERVAVLLKADGELDLAGSVGWHPDGVGPVGRYDLSILTKLGAKGAGLIESADRRELVNAGLLGNEAQTIVVAPLEHENVAFGVLLVGHEEPDSEASPQVNGSFDGIVSFARSVAPDLHAWLLLHRLRAQLASHGKAQDIDPEPAPDAATPNTTKMARQQPRQQPQKQTRSQRKR